jgi:hypothetical protein
MAMIEDANPYIRPP